MLETINTAIEWVQANGWAVVGAQYVFSCFVQSLPEPVVKGSNWYLFLYRFSHTLAGNVNVVRKPLKGAI